MKKISLGAIVLTLVAVVALVLTGTASADALTVLTTGSSQISTTLQSGETWVWQIPANVNGRLYLDGGFTAGDNFAGTPTVIVDGTAWNISWTCGPAGQTTICSLQALTSTPVHGGSQIVLTVPGSSAHYVEVKLRLLYETYLPMIRR